MQSNGFLNLKISALILPSSRHTAKVGLSTMARMLGLLMPQCLDSKHLNAWGLDAWTIGVWKLGLWMPGVSTLKFCRTGCLDTGGLHDWMIRLWTLGLWTPGRLNNKLTFNNYTLTTKEIL